LNTLIDTFTLVGRYRTYSLYPLLSYIFILIITFTAIIPLLEGVLGPDQKDLLARAFFLLVVYLAYGVLYFVIVVCNVALVTGIAARLDGDDPGLWVGPLARAFQRLRLIGRYTLVSATLGVVSLLARMFINPFFGGVIMPFVSDKLWVRWRQLSYNIPLQLAVPVIALDHPAPGNIFKRVELLVKETWGERVKAAHSIRLLALLILPIIILFAIPTLRQGLAEGNHGLIWPGLSVMLITISTYTQVSALVNAIFALAAYRYAVDRKSDVFPGDASYAEHAFVRPKKETNQANPQNGSISNPSSVVSDDLSN
jgi:hypothetical protein